MVLSDNSSFSTVGFTAFAVAIIGAGATFIIGLLNYRRQGQLLESQRTYQDRQIDLMRSAEITDRFSQAIEQMGSDSDHVRMGGIFAMERIARDMPGDHQYVVEPWQPSCGDVFRLLTSETGVTCRYCSYGLRMPRRP